MNLARRLPRFYRRLDQLAAIIAEVEMTTEATALQFFAADRALIQLQVEWEHFVRNLILDSATGKYTNGSGQITSHIFPNLPSREAAAHQLVGTYPNRQFEPDWYLPIQAIDASQRLGVSNFAEIAAELGITPWPIDELRHVRNFIAHQSKRSALSVRRTGIIANSVSIDVWRAATGYSSRGMKRYVEWIEFSKGAARRLVG